MKYLNKKELLRDLFRDLGLADKTLHNTSENPDLSQYAEDLLRAWINIRDGVLKKGGPTWENLIAILTNQGHHGAVAEIKRLEAH